MNGGGNVNYYKNMNHKGRHVRWFFVYYGYSKFLDKAYAYVNWYDKGEYLSFLNVKHYYSPKFWFSLGKDRYYPGFNG